MAVGKKITDLTASGSLKDTDLAIIHDGNGTKRSTLTQLGEYMGTKFSNPNLLINPDFKINQRGKTSYEVTGFDYTVDRWRVSSSDVAVSESGGLTIHSTGSEGSWFTQKLEKELEGIATLSIKVSSINGKISLSSPSNNLFIASPGVYSITLSDINEFNMFLNPNTSVTIEWTKLEKGSIATPFVAPNPAEELVKCARFLQIIPEIYFIPYASTRAVFSSGGRYYQSTDGLFPVEMRTNPTITYSNIHKANDEVISEKVTSIDSNKYGITIAIIGNDVDYYTLRMKNIIADAEMY